MRYRKTAMVLNDDNSCDDIGDGDMLKHSHVNNTGDMQPDATHPTSLPSSHQQPKMDTEEANKTTSSGLDTMLSSDQGAQAVQQSQTSHETPYLHVDNIDGHLESRKRGRLTKGSAYKPSDEDNTINSNKPDEMHGTFSQTSAENDDDYDIEEDVKVCDICGDAGREDLLAVCSRCSDGAEHTYCMREMLDKVPDGDWLCEECKYNGQVEERKVEQQQQQMHGTRSVGRSKSVINDFVKSDLRSKMKNVGQKKQVSSKRPAANFEAGPTSKRLAVESSTGLPTASARGAALKDTSLDKIKGNSFNKIISGDPSQTLRSPTTTSLNANKGNFTKSNSFNTGNSKLNVKLSDEVQKKKHGGGIDGKDMGGGKSITKSMSFKGLGRSNVSEPKVKMLSPHCAPVQELKGLKQGRERISVERKNTIKADQSTPSDQITTTITCKHPSRADTNISSLCATNSHHDHKNSLPDGKLTTHSKHSFQSIHKLSQATDNTGEVKRQSSASISGSVPVNGIGSSAEARPDTVSITELPGLNNGAKAADVVNNQNDKAVENSYGRLRQGGVNGGGGKRCEISTTKEGMHKKENNLKAAIEAAMQKKQDMYRKNRNMDKSNELSTPSNSRGSHPVLNIISSSSDAAASLVEEGALRNNTCKSAPSAAAAGGGGTMKQQLNVYPAAAAPAPIVSAIPEQDSVWQGGFEIHRNGKFPDMCGGFQAHLSSMAAVRVIESVKKFPQKIVLDEVPRPCVWPMQFKEIGAQEDNVALYFFAKDSESYIRSYKMLVDYLMKHDLALRGRVDEVELLVFPSNHLPDKSQCWNALFFMWGVLRGRRPVEETAEMCMMSNLIPPSNKDDDTNTNVAVSISDTPTASVRCSNGGDSFNQRYPHHPTSLRGPTFHFSTPQTAPLNDLSDEAPVKVVNYQQLAANKVDGGSRVLKSHELPSSHSGAAASLVSGQAVGSQQHRLDTVKCESSINPPHLGCVDNIKKNVGEVKDEDDKVDPMQKNDSGKSKTPCSWRQEGYVDMNISADNDREEESEKMTCSQKRPWLDGEDPLQGRDVASTNIKRRRGGDDLNGVQRPNDDDSGSLRDGGVSSSSRTQDREEFREEGDDDKSGGGGGGSDARYMFIDDTHHPGGGDGGGGGGGGDSMYWKVGLSEEHEERLPGGSPNLELALGVEMKQTRDLSSSKEDKDKDKDKVEDEEDASASLSLSLAFPFSDKERTSSSRLGRPPPPPPGTHESPLFFRGSSQN